VEEQGFDLTARELAQYWLDYIGYNFDEYGLNKANLRLGLLPPVSGYYNNWFRDCMGAPIRSEIWACLAPGSPALAVRYAYQDAIVDHAGGEGAWGELFNAAVQSAAFVEHDPQTLLDIGLSYIPPDSATARTVHAARRAS
jgi:ADP-ribosylglycohydrolase